MSEQGTLSKNAAMRKWDYSICNVQERYHNQKSLFVVKTVPSLGIKQCDATFGIRS